MKMVDRGFLTANGSCAWSVEKEGNEIWFEINGNLFRFTENDFPFLEKMAEALGNAVRK